MPAYLFIGGAADGMRISIDTDENLVILNDKQLPKSVEGCRIYERSFVEIQKSLRTVTVFVSDAMAQSAALELLVARYPVREVQSV